MWAAAIYDLHLTSDQFYALTPRQYALLIKAHRRDTVHREMIQAYTTAAIINYSLAAPDTPAQPIAFMPNYEAPKTVNAIPVKKFTQDELLDWHTRVQNLAAELKQGYGPMLDEIKAKANG